MEKNAHFLIVALVLVGGCAAEETPSTPAEAAPAAELAAPDDPLAALGGDYAFSLDDSGVKGALERKCAAAEAPGPCFAAVRDAAAGEGVEILRLAGDRARYLAYGHEDGERVVHVDAEVALRWVGDGLVELTPERVDVGPPLPPGARLLLEIVDEATIAMDKAPGAHPRTGGQRLVFHRRAR